MGLISRLKSNLQKSKVQKDSIMSQQVVWSIVRQNHAFLVKSRKSGGVQFSKHPGNLKNKNTLKYSAIANPKPISIQAGKDGKGVVLKCGKQSVEWGAHKGQRNIVVKPTNVRPSQPRSPRCRRQASVCSHPIAAKSLSLFTNVLDFRKQTVHS